MPKVRKFLWPLGLALVALTVGASGFFLPRAAAASAVGDRTQKIQSSLAQSQLFLDLAVTRVAISASPIARDLTPAQFWAKRGPRRDQWRRPGSERRRRHYQRPRPLGPPGPPQRLPDSYFIQGYTKCNIEFKNRYGDIQVLRRGYDSCVRQMDLDRLRPPFQPDQRPRHR